MRGRWFAGCVLVGTIAGTVIAISVRHRDTSILQENRGAIAVIAIILLGVLIALRPRGPKS